MGQGDWQADSEWCLCDNAAVVVIRSGSSKNERAAQLMHGLVLDFFTAGLKISLVVEHQDDFHYWESIMEQQTSCQEITSGISVTGIFGSEGTTPNQ